MMDFRIHTFITVCRYMNLTKAAGQLNITQPAVTQHLHYLEAFYDVKLFSYEGKRMRLTEAGQTLYQVAVTMQHDEIYLKERLHTLEQRKKRLIFGATLTIGEFVMPEHLRSYLDRYPEIEVRMTIGNTRELLDKLSLGEIDFALIEGNFAKQDYDCMVYSREEYIPVCSANYQFDLEPELFTDLLSERIILREEGSGTREILEKNLESRNLGVKDFRHSVEIGGMNAIKALVDAGCGITFMYQAAVKKELAAGALREIKLRDFHILHDFMFIWNKGSAFSEEYRQICEGLKGIS